MTRRNLMLVTLAVALGAPGVTHAQARDSASSGYIDRYLDVLFGYPDEPRYDDRYDDRYDGRYGGRYDDRDRYDDGRRGRWFRLATVRADPRDGRDVIQLGRTGPIDRLELRATHGGVWLERVRIRMRDGQVVSRSYRGWLRGGDAVRIALPPSRRGVDSIVLRYGDRDRAAFGRSAGARVEVWASEDRRRGSGDRPVYY